MAFAEEMMTTSRVTYSIKSIIIINETTLNNKINPKLSAWVIAGNGSDTLSRTHTHTDRVSERESWI